MRTTTGPELTTLAALTRDIAQRIKIANGSGTMIDLTSWVEEVTHNVDLDRPVSALTIHFRRDSGTILSLSPLRTDSTLNRLDDGTTYSPQIAGGRRVTWEVATTPVGTAPVAGDYKLLFDGYTDEDDSAQSPLTVECRDKGGVIVDRGIEVEAAYGSAGGVALETVMQQILDAVFGSGFIPLDVPVSPSFLIAPSFIQQRQSTMDAMQALAQLPGWDARYWWDSGSSSFKFRLQNPPRTKTTPDHTLGPNAYYAINRLALSRTDVKNVIAVSYFDTAANARLVVTVSDSASITKYTRRYFYVQEADGSPINTNAEATSMANAMLSDLKEPKAEAEIEMPFCWPLELWDLDRFSANGVHINTDQDWAVVSITHKLAAGPPPRHRTFLTVRGTPAGGYLTWLDRGEIAGGEHRPGEVGPEPKIEVFGAMTATQAQVLYTAVGGTAPLTYQRRIDVDDVSTGTYSAPAALGSGVTEWITLHAGDRATRIFLRVIDATGLQGNADPFFLPGQVPSIEKSSGKVKRAIPLDDGKHAASSTTSDGNMLDAPVRQTLAGVSRALAKGYQAGYSRDGVAVTFDPVYQNPPQVVIHGGRLFSSSLGTGSAQYEDFAATGLTASGFTTRAKLKNKGTVTARDDEFTSSLTTTTAGGTVGPATIGDAPSLDNNYKARYEITVVCTTTIGAGSTTVVVAIEVSLDSGSNWTEYATRSYDALRVTAGTITEVYSGQEVTVNVAGLDNTDKIRLKLKSITYTGDATGTPTLEGYDNSPGAEGHGVTYSTMTGGGIEGKTPDADDSVMWEAFEVVA